MSMFREATKADGTKGDVSIRRVIAFICAMASFITGSLAIYKAADWKVVALSFGIPLLAALILLFFTTLTELKELALTIKEIKDGKL